jgi:hypothetical protein
MLILINSILGENFATSVEFLDKEVQTDRVLAKKSVFDFLCKTPNGEAIVEVQVREDKHFGERLLFYSTYIVQEQYNRYRRKKMEEQYLQKLKKREKKLEGSEFRIVPVLGDEYVGGFTYEMHPVYVIAIMGFNMARHEEEGRPRNNDVIRSFEIRDEISGELLTDRLHFTLVELARFQKQEKDLSSSSDRLLFSFKNMAKQKKIPESFKNTNMAKIYNTAQLAALSDEEYRAYVSEIFEEERRLNEQATTFNEGKRQGREEGREEGEKNKAIEIARNGLRKGLSVDDVAEITGLSIEEVVSLKENLK